MLDQLVESKSHAAEDTKRSGFLLTTFIVMVTILMSAWLYSLFAKDFGMGGDELSLETLVAPPVIEDAPEPEARTHPRARIQSARIGPFPESAPAPSDRGSSR